MIDKRAALLSSALELFSIRGYENTPTSLISKNAGVATGTLFHHFSSKEELINQLYLDCKLKMMQQIENSIKAAKSTDDKIKAVWEAMIRWALENEERFLFIMQNKRNSYIKEETRQQVKTQSDELKAFILEIDNLNTLRNLPPDLIAEISSSMIDGAISYFRRNPEQYADSKIREAAYQVFKNAFMK
ncbi:MAG: TetR/AcrR family transcriptional regulator [Spirochaetales bacterium]|uniref:TetR/AcrR family transcriptional regulator n=1 Tax=Candidatus Thalassospirochaeta sargassi TaxID=3119039 RepID=A0AAJ1IGI7_9SPIO|nr:TetR/AcrR family transcriptional regulator [Spirochaetales bacterium]